jgi:uncharacterized MAPEG superfamily protein
VIQSIGKMANIPPWAMQLFQSLSEEQQSNLVMLGSKAVMDPWFGALASIPLALNLVYVPHFLKLGVVTPFVHVNYNNVSPRYTDWDETIKHSPVVDFVKRCISCHQNAWEAFIAFVPAVLMCRVQKADGKAIRELCMKFLRIRVLYTILYVVGHWRIVSVLRTVVWGAGMQVIGELYMKALLA